MCCVGYVPIRVDGRVDHGAKVPVHQPILGTLAGFETVPTGSRQARSFVGGELGSA